jgi:hypothetical protein
MVIYDAIKKNTRKTLYYSTDSWYHLVFLNLCSHLKDTSVLFALAYII